MADDSARGRNKRRLSYSSPSTLFSSSSSGGSDGHQAESSRMGRPQRRRSRYEHDPSYPEPRGRQALRSSRNNDLRTVEDGDQLNEAGCSAGAAEPSPRGRRGNVRGGRGRRGRRASYFTRSSSSRTNSAAPSQRRTILSWLIDSKVVENNAKVVYKNETGEMLLQGMLSGDGIRCGCCNTVITVSEFQLHAGDEPHRPYQRIFIAEAGLSLLQCQAAAWNQQDIPELQGFHLIEPKEDAADKYDDACVVCADGGNLICCDKCPSTYHISCLQMESEPQGEWHCPGCACKFCNVHAFDFPVFTCSQCEKKYHWECYRENEGMEIDLNIDGPSTSASFCSNHCREMYEKLGRLVGVTNELDEGLTWTLVRRIDPGGGGNSEEFYDRTVCNSKTAVAVTVMEECFEPVIDRHTQIDVVRSVVYNCGSNFPRISFEGFYTAVLEKADEIITVASLRFHGDKLAEMPFVATRSSYRQQGMCHKLLVAIESTLCFLGVQRLIIPSIAGRVKRWKESYGFEDINSEVTRETIKLKSLMFHCAIRLQKPLMTHEPAAAAAKEVGNGANAGNGENAGYDSFDLRPVSLRLQR